ncbi:PTS sugar transporter subunit IIC [Anaerococcus murdochii]|uniref:PTS sugar transporter subunit IIC n=1 Tax=Anaerococcus murdochii TaxID=411577 RepID=A0ABS7SY31_9FIRM|nr:PTS sugar transporter subunit IIC [Anaerococcus murdochii]MBZ2386407.1 PTS sugar transporter subunit IIC [Anaerococcus murdochii]
MFLQALLAGIFCYLGAVDAVPAFGVTGGYYILGRPLVAGLVLGIIFGDIKAGVLCGLAVQGVFIASMHTGGASSSEITYASYGGIGLALATTKDPAIAVTLALFIGQTFGLIFYNVKMAGFSYFNRKAELACKNFDKRSLVMNQIVYPQLITAFIRIVPVFIAIYYGSGAVEKAVSYFPEIVTNIITVLGGVLPALGIGMLLNILIQEKVELIFFLFGFALVSFTGLSTVGLVFIALLIAYMMYYSSTNVQSMASKSEDMVVVEGELFEDEDLF